MFINLTVNINLIDLFPMKKFFNALIGLTPIIHSTPSASQLLATIRHLGPSASTPATQFGPPTPSTQFGPPTTLRGGLILWR